MKKAERILITVIAFAAVMLAAVGINRLYRAYTDKKFEEARVARYEEVTATTNALKGTISEVSVLSVPEIKQYIEENAEEDTEEVSFWDVPKEETAPVEDPWKNVEFEMQTTTEAVDIEGTEEVTNNVDMTEDEEAVVGSFIVPETSSKEADDWEAGSVRENVDRVAKLGFEAVKSALNQSKAEDEGSTVNEDGIVGSSEAESTPTPEKEEEAESTPPPEKEEEAESTPTPEKEEETESTPTLEKEEEAESTPTPEKEEEAESTPTPEKEEETESTPTPEKEEEAESTPTPENVSDDSSDISEEAAGSVVNDTEETENKEESVRRIPTLKERQSFRTSMEETKLWMQADSKTLEHSSLDFSDKKIVCLGDSVTEGTNLADDPDYRNYIYPTRLQQILNAKEVVNLGIGGSSLGRYWDRAFCDRYKDIPEDTDIIVIMGGYNDGYCLHEDMVGSMEECAERTLYGDVDALMRGLRDDYPNAYVIVATPLPNLLHDVLRKERPELLSQTVIINCLKEMAEKYDYAFLDNYDANFMDSHDPDIVSAYIPDSVHPNREGYDLLARHIAAEMVRIFSGMDTNLDFDSHENEAASEAEEIQSEAEEKPTDEAKTLSEDELQTEAEEKLTDEVKTPLEETPQPEAGYEQGSTVNDTIEAIPSAKPEKESEAPDMKPGPTPTSAPTVIIGRD